MPIPKTKPKLGLVPQVTIPAGASTEPLDTVSSPEIDLSVWEEQTVSVTYDDGHKEKYTCKVYGQMCVLPSTEVPGKWAVIHKDSWHVITRLNTEEDAMRVGTTLWEECMMAWMHSTKEELLESLPAWVKEYALQCIHSGKWMDPTQFIGG
jgi:hypothetical protein